MDELLFLYLYFFLYQEFYGIFLETRKLVNQRREN